MYEYLDGKVEYKKPDYLAIDVNGVGYKVDISLRTFDQVSIGDRVRMYVYNYIKEDTYKLIGFLDERERLVFDLLLKVKGIGITLALSVMSTFDVDTIRDLVAQDDYKNLKKVPKMGEKKAQQFILDLKSKLKMLDKLSTRSREEVVVNYLEIEDELYDALEGLGYNKKEIGTFITREELKEFATIEEAVKAVLKKINK
ncbi:Holliday junction branch migration protein RuvA [Fusobacterium sp. PH5-44]|uniref:Holliday junction branch migration protein RuvA n=1 Tax=unclassified Fusobacterium TaxID=2648384 RepID=UPI003D192D66